MRLEEYNTLFDSIIIELEELKTSSRLPMYIDKVIEEARLLNEAGRKEYASDKDVFSNFEGISDYLDITKESVLMVYLKKHLDGIRSYIRGHRSQREDVRGRIMDAIVYLILLRAMVETNQETNG